MGGPQYAAGSMCMLFNFYKSRFCYIQEMFLRLSIYVSKYDSIVCHTREYNNRIFIHIYISHAVDDPWGSYSRIGINNMIQRHANKAYSM